MILKHFYEDSLAQSAYLVGCAETGDALVIDPLVDIRPYVDAAAAEGLRIRHVAETHIHADFVSGARALAGATGATLRVSGEGGPEWQYTFPRDTNVVLMGHGDIIQVGRLRIDVLHTPGHTPEHVTLLLTDTRAADTPLGAFTGDFLFVGDVGRPDLLETAAGQRGTMAASARTLFASLRALAPLPDHLLIWPGHGSGSACGKSLSGVPMSSLGFERLANRALRETNEAAFVASVLEDQPDPPMYFGEMKRVNRSGARAWTPPPLRAIDAAELPAIVDEGRLLIDVRGDSREGLLPGAIAIPAGRSFSAWAGSVVPDDAPFFIVAPGEGDAAAAARVLALIGRPRTTGWVSPAAIAAYRQRGGTLEPVEMLDHVPAGHSVLDVRSTAEWRTDHLEEARHVPLARLPERAHGLDRTAPVVVYCQTGARSYVAATALRRLGFSRVAHLAGGLTGYRERSARREPVS